MGTAGTTPPRPSLRHTVSILQICPRIRNLASRFELEARSIPISVMDGFFGYDELTSTPKDFVRFAKIPFLDTFGAPIQWHAVCNLLGGKRGEDAWVISGSEKVH